MKNNKLFKVHYVNTVKYNYYVLICLKSLNHLINNLSLYLLVRK